MISRYKSIPITDVSYYNMLCYVRCDGIIWYKDVKCNMMLDYTMK